MSFKVINFFMSKSFKTFLKHTAKDFHNQSVNPPVVGATQLYLNQCNILERSAKAQKILQVAIMIMEDKEHQQHIFFKKFLLNLKKVIMYLQHQQVLVQF